MNLANSVSRSCYDEVFVPARNITSAEWNFAVGPEAGLFERLSKWPLKLGAVADLFVGIQTDADDVYILEEVRRSKDRVLCRSRYTSREHWLEADHLKPFLKGSLNIRRYHFSGVSKLLVFPYETRDGKSVLLPPAEYAERFPLTWAYLSECQPRLSARNKGRMGEDWYGYVYRKNHTRMVLPKLLVPSLSTGSCFAPDLEGTYTFVGSGGGGGGGYGVTLREPAALDYGSLLGILNSTLISRYLRATSTPFRGGYIALNRQYIELLPVAVPGEEAASVLRLAAEKMTALHARASAASSPDEKEAVQRQLHATDRQIDALVYQLYSLTREEIAIVEVPKPY